MERLPDQHGRELQAPEGREVFHRRHDCLRRSEHQGSQDDPLCLQPLLQGAAGGEPRQAPHHHPEGCSFPAPDSHPRVHVCRRGERGTGPTASVPEDC